MMRFAIVSTSLLAFISLTAVAAEEVEITHAWTRATAPGQQVGAAYMTLQSKTDMALERVESAVAGSVEIHSMTMKDGVMQMRMLETLPLKANQPEKLAPGGFHLMLFDLKKPLKVGESVDYTLHFKDSAGKTSTQHLISPIKRTAD
jgi:copper(I)-binding protein